MRRTASYLVTLVLVAGVIVAPPAHAAFDALVELPEGPIYSPYGGPVAVTFTFEESDGAAIYTVRLRQPGHGTIRERDYLVDPTIHSSPHPVSFSWSELTVATATDLVIDVRRSSDGMVLASEPFTLSPRLVSDLSATPSPFYPLIQDGYKDRTKIGFSLAADAADTVVHVFRDDPDGRCCGREIRTDHLGALAAGTRRWTWDGTEDDASTAPKGTYFVKVEATDTNDVTDVSRAQRVDIATGWIRRTATKEKAGSAYTHVDERQIAIGGDCIVGRDTASKVLNILCANAAVTVSWRWALAPKERIEAASFEIDGGYYGCGPRVGHTTTESTLDVYAPPTATCTVFTAKIRYSYPVQV